MKPKRIDKCRGCKAAMTYRGHGRPAEFCRKCKGGDPWRLHRLDYVRRYRAAKKGVAQ